MRGTRGVRHFEVPEEACRRLLRSTPEFQPKAPGASAASWHQALRAHDKWWTLLYAANQTFNHSASAARRTTAARAPLILEVRSSTKRGGGLGVFARQPFKEGDVITEFAGVHHLGTPLQDFQKRLTSARLHGASGWQAGIDKIFSCQLPPPDTFHPPLADGGAQHEIQEDGDRVLTVFGAHFVEEGEGEEEQSGAGTSAGAASGVAAGTSAGVAQVMNDQGCVRLGAGAWDGLAGRGAVEEAEVRGASISEAASAYLEGLEGGAANAAMVPVGDLAGQQLGLFAVAARDVEAGEEVLFSYGLRWWLGRARSELRNKVVAACLLDQPSGSGFLAADGSYLLPASHPLRKALESFALLSAEVVDRERSAVGVAGVMARGGVGLLEPLEGRRLDNFLFQRACLVGLGLGGLDPQAQFDALTQAAQAGDPRITQALIPPWKK
mmetsp:Transcript_27259/g.60929  ORF Transcript_27259/g.60929 Transcript_27259/m.60929 type:complete len:439 (-) Transcript_27259:280-1596(-)